MDIVPEKKLGNNSLFPMIFKLIILVCVVIFTAGNAYYYFIFLPGEQTYNRTESKRYECRQDVQSLINEYNSIANSLEQNEENQQILFNYALNLGIIDESGNPIKRNELINKCLRGELSL